MTIQNVIARVDELEPNQYSEQMKMDWLTELDGKIWEEVIRTHEDPPRESFEPYSSATSELLVGFPYAADLYCWFLQARIAAENAEAAKYMQMGAMYNDALQNWTDWYNRTHRPKSGGSRFLF